jgi:hypothetical protein
VAAHHPKSGADADRVSLLSPPLDEVVGLHDVSIRRELSSIDA